MVTIHPSALHKQADSLLTQAKNPKKLVLIHTAIALGSSLLIAVFNYLFHLQIAETGGLSGLGLRSILETCQSILELAVSVALPFWQIGLVFAAMQWMGGEQAGVSSLFQGFRRFGPVLRFYLLYAGLFLALTFPLMYICSFLFAMTPFSAPLSEILEPLMDPNLTPQQIEEMMTDEMMASMMQAMIPMLIMFAIVYLLVAIPIAYRLRFGTYGVMSGSHAGAAMAESFRITRKNTWQLVKLDLHFWWYYLLQVLCVGISYGYSLLTLAGIPLPISEDAGFFLCLVLSSLVQGIFLWQYEARVQSTYALAYRTFRDDFNGVESVAVPTAE